jgi:hypothetical protein
MHDRLRLIGSDIEHGSQFAQSSRHIAILLADMYAVQKTIACPSTFDRDVVLLTSALHATMYTFDPHLDGDGHPVERSHHLTGLFEMLI